MQRTGWLGVSRVDARAPARILTDRSFLSLESFRVTTYSSLNYRASEGLVSKEIKRPPDNILDIGLMRELGRAVDQVSADETANALLITGAGEKFLSAGVDVKMRVVLTPGF